MNQIPTETITDADRVRIADANLKALLDYSGGFYSVAMEHGMKRGETANAIAHVESAARALHRLAIASSLSSRSELIDALKDLVQRCNGAEGVRADGSNIQTIRATAILEKLGEL